MPPKNRSKTPVSNATPTKTSALKGKKETASKNVTPVSNKGPAKKSVGNSRSVTPVKTAQKSESKKEGARKFYTVQEDWTIWQAFRAGSKKNATVSVMAKWLAKNLSRSEESVRDRIKRYISKLGDNQESKLAKAAKETPNWHAHFANDKKGPPFKVISSITSDDPSVNFKQSSAKRAQPKAASPEKQSPSKSPAPSRGPVARKQVLSKRSPSKASRSNTPSKPVKKVKTAEKSSHKTVSNSKPAMNDKHSELRGKVGDFLGGLESKKTEDVKKNAEVLAEIVKGFSSSYGVELSDVMNLLSKNNSVNCQDVRNRLTTM